MYIIQKELLHKDYGIYWEKTGVNKRLQVYQRIQDLAEYIISAIDVVLYLILLMLLKNFTVLLLEQSGNFFEIFTKEELIKGISIDIFRISISVSLCYTFILFLWIKHKHRLFRYEIKKCMRFLCFFYAFYILNIFCLDLILMTSMLVVVLLLIRKSLQLYIDRVCQMTNYATGIARTENLK